MDHKDLCEHTRIRLIAAALGHQQCTKTSGTETHIPGTDKRILIGNDAYLAKVAAPATGFQNDGREPDWNGYAAAEAAHAQQESATALSDVEISDICVELAQNGHGNMRLDAARAFARMVQSRLAAVASFDAKPLAHGHRDDYHLMANARRIAQHPIAMIRAMPNWALAHELFATGSTSARRICLDAGIDPDGVTVERRGQLGITVKVDPNMAPGTVRMQSGRHSVTVVNVGPAPLTRCAAGRDGECGHAQCPQLRDDEPRATGRHCPLDNRAED